MTEEYFPKPINDTTQFFKRLEREGKVINLNSPEDLKAMQEMNKIMKEVEEDYRRMSAGSIESARKCYFTD